MVNHWLLFASPCVTSYSLLGISGIGVYFVFTYGFVMWLRSQESCI